MVLFLCCQRNRTTVFIANAEKISQTRPYELAFEIAASSVLSSSETHVFETLKKNIINKIKDQGLYYAYSIVDNCINDIEKNETLTPLGAEIIKATLKKIPVVITRASIRQPVDDIIKPSITDYYWILPCKGKNKNNYGEKRKTHIHDGIDIIVPSGTPVKAVADGIIIKKNIDSKGINNGYGKFIVIEHNVNGKTVTSEYGHLSEWKKEKGDIVKQGDIIALSGNTGLSTAPHVHLTIREGSYRGKAVNPNKYINY